MRKKVLFLSMIMALSMSMSSVAFASPADSGLDAPSSVTEASKKAGTTADEQEAKSDVQRHLKPEILNRILNRSKLVKRATHKRRPSDRRRKKYF